MSSEIFADPEGGPQEEEELIDIRATIFCLDL